MPEKKKITFTGHFLTADQILWGYAMWVKGYYKWEIGEALDVSTQVLHIAFRRNGLANHCSDPKRYRLSFDSQEISSELIDRAHRSLWAHFKVNPKIITKTELRYAVYQIPENRIKNWFDLFDRVWGKEKAFPGGNPRKAKKK